MKELLLSNGESIPIINMVEAGDSIIFRVNPHKMEATIDSIEELLKDNLDLIKVVDSSISEVLKEYNTFTRLAKISYISDFPFTENSTTYYEKVVEFALTQPNKNYATEEDICRVNNKVADLKDSSDTLEGAVLELAELSASSAEEIETINNAILELAEIIGGDTNG